MSDVSDPVPPPMPVQPWTPDGAMSFGWRLMKERPECILVMFLGCLLAALVATAGAVVAVAMDMAHGGRPSPESIAVRVIFDLLNFPIAVFFWIGMTRYGLKLCGGEETGVSELFSGGRFLSMFGATFLVAVGMIAACGLLIVPGVILMLGLYFFRQLIVDRDMGAFDALSACWKLTTGHKVQLFVFWLFSIGVAILGTCACGVGIFVAVPVIHLATTKIYLDLTGQKSVEI